MRLWLGFFLLFLFSFSFAQKQLVILKGERVVLRLYPGDDFVYSLKNKKGIKRSYVNNLSDTSVVTHRDTVAFNKIKRIYFRRTTRANVIGSALVVAGCGLFAIDQLNHTVLQGNDFDIDRGVSQASLFGIGVGLPLMLIKKKSPTIRYPYRLRTVEKGSVFYQSRSDRSVWPYLGN